MPVERGVGRHFHVEEPRALWNCVACGRENAGPLTQGCSFCGAGKPTAAHPSVATSGIDLPTFIRRGFEEWLRNQEPGPADLNTLLPQVFFAGYEFAMNQLDRSTPVRTSTGTGTEVGTAAGREARTLAAALALFIENILVNLPDEVEAGEWITVEEAKALLTRLQEEGRK